MNKLRVGVLFGGRSGEHEISLLSAASVLKALDKDKYDVVPIGITKEGRWLTETHAERLLLGENPQAKLRFLEPERSALPTGRAYAIRPDDWHFVNLAR